MTTVVVDFPAPPLGVTIPMVGICYFGRYGKAFEKLFSI